MASARHAAGQGRSESLRPFFRPVSRRTPMKHTPLHEVHAAMGARLVEFSGWHMPLSYGPILEEARHVRAGVGLFDLGHK